MIEYVRTFLELNRDLIFFLYGLSFFVLGFSIALQSRQSSRLDLARSLTWLAAFGILHGFHEWGEYFIPIQAAYLSPPVIDLLQGLRLLLLAVSFACLMEFGARLLRPHPLAQRLTLLNAALMAFWLFVTYFPLAASLDGQAWYNAGDALARYSIGLPGGLLAGYALRRHTLQRIAPLDVPHIVRRLRIVGLSLVVYGLVGGLVPPPVPFFPGNVINSASFEAALVFPPPVPRSLLGLFMAYFTIRALEIFDLEISRRLETMEQEQILQAEHRRLARDLHDGALQKVYTAGLLVETLGNHIQDSDTAHTRLERAVSALNNAIQDLRGNLRELSPAPTGEPLLHRLQQITLDPRFQSFLNVEFEADISEQLELDPLRAEHISAIVSEALSNAVRHAQATRAKVFVQRNDETLIVRVQDDGTGLGPDEQTGFGIRNMRDRARLLDGKLRLEHREGGGTLVELEAPVSSDS